MSSATRNPFLRIQNFNSIEDLDLQFTKDEETNTESLIVSGVAHTYKVNKKKIQFTKDAVRFAVQEFSDRMSKEGAKTSKAWIDHAYINPFGTATPSMFIVGQVTELQFSNKGLLYKVDINTKHPSQIHIAIARQDIDGGSVGIDIERENIRCKLDGKALFTDECEHRWGASYDEGVAVGVVTKYIFDEFSFTGIPADEDTTAKVQFSDDVDLESDLFKMKLGANIPESFKSDLNQNKSDSVMTDDNDISEGEITGLELDNFVTKDDISELREDIKTFAEVSKSFKSYIENQHEKEKKAEEAQKKGLVKQILSTEMSKEFSEESLMTFSVEQLEGLVRVSQSVSSGDRSYGQTRVGLGDPSNNFHFNEGEDKMPREIVKAWFRKKLGWSTEAPKHIQKKVRATLDGINVEQTDELREFTLRLFGGMEDDE